jgi:hypothetical protein
VSEAIVGGLPPAELEKYIEKEFEMALQDRVMEETKDKKNAVEAYVYDMRNKVLLLLACATRPDQSNSLSCELMIHAYLVHFNRYSRNTKTLLLMLNGKSLFQSFKMLRIGYMKKERMKLKVFMWLSWLS